MGIIDYGSSVVDKGEREAIRIEDREWELLQFRILVGGFK